MLAVVRLALARRRGDLESALREVGPLLEPVEADSVTELTLSNDARAVALMNLGIVELWSFRLDDAERHLEQGLALARLIDRPYVQIGCLSHLGLDAARRSLALARQRSLEAIAIAEAHGWATDPIACTALAMMALADAAQGRFEEGRRWLDRAEHSIRAEPRPRHGPARALRARRAARRRGPARRRRSPSSGPRSGSRTCWPPRTR